MPLPQEHACRLREPGTFQPDSFRRTERQHEGKPYGIIMGRLRGQTTMTEQAYRYDRDVWTEAEARDHCRAHEGKAFEPATEDAESSVTLPRRPAFELACSVPWAILPTWLPTLLEIAAREHQYDPQAVAAQLGRPLDHSHNVTIRDGVAILPIEGPLFRRANLFTEVSGATSVEILAQDLRRALDDPLVHSIVLAIDSPGGEVNGIHEFADMVYAARAQKPILAYVSHLGASAAYWIASAAQEVVLDATAAVGSIGVIAAVRAPGQQSAKDIEFVSSQSPRKRPDPTTEAGRAQVQALVDGLAEEFIVTVARNRGVSREKVLVDFGQGAVVLGRAAVEVGLADRLGAFEAVLAELQRRAGPAAGGGHMGFREKWAQFTASLSPQEMAELGTPEPRIEAVPGNVTGVLLEAGPDPATAERITALETALATERADRETAAAQAAAASERIAAMEAAARKARFTAEVRGKSDANGTPWVGDIDKHVAMLERLAAAFGEDDAAVHDYVEQNRAHAAQLERSGLLAELGRDGSGSAQTAAGQIDAKARALAAERHISVEQATVLVAEQERALYATHMAEMRQARG